MIEQYIVAATMPPPPPGLGPTLLSALALFIGLVLELARVRGW